MATPYIYFSISHEMLNCLFILVVLILLRSCSCWFCQKCYHGGWLLCLLHFKGVILRVSCLDVIGFCFGMLVFVGLRIGSTVLVGLLVIYCTFLAVNYIILITYLLICIHPIITLNLPLHKCSTRIYFNFSQFISNRNSR